MEASLRRPGRGQRKATYHLPNSPIPNDQFGVLIRNSETYEFNCKGDPGTTDLLGSIKVVAVVCQGQLENALEGQFVRRTIQEVEEVDVYKSTEHQVNDS